MKNPAAGGGRWVEVPPERLVSWIVTFESRHGSTVPTSPVGSVVPVSRAASGAMVTFTAADGATAECHLPFPPLPAWSSPALEATGTVEAMATPAPEAVVAAEAVVAHAIADRTVGVLLVRLGGYAVGVFAGSPPRLLDAKTGSRLVHGRSAAGGWSQHRFARRRENQAAIALRAAADAAVGMFGRYGPAGLDAVVLGGDKRSAAGLRGDTRLAVYLARTTDRFLTVPDPRLAVLRESPRAFGSIRIRLTEPESPAPESPAPEALDRGSPGPGLPGLESNGPVRAGPAKLGDVLPITD
jgi:Actinobacteria/chloroflexi VLRF1 release factor